mgnify:CR=1 FL=1
MIHIELTILNLTRGIVVIGGSRINERVVAVSVLEFQSIGHLP